MTVTTAARGYVYTENATITFVTEECCNCGVLFALTEEFHDSARRRSAAASEQTKWFYCPNGHRQHYTGENKEQKLKRQLQAERDRAGRLAHDLDQTEARRVAQKAATTRAKKRHAAGVCPACKRTFANVQRHMTSQHPDYDPASPRKENP